MWTEPAALAPHRALAAAAAAVVASSPSTPPAPAPSPTASAVEVDSSFAWSDTFTIGGALSSLWSFVGVAALLCVCLSLMHRRWRRRNAYALVGSGADADFETRTAFLTTMGPGDLYLSRRDVELSGVFDPTDVGGGAASQNVLSL